MDWKNLDKSKSVKISIAGIIGIIALIIVFQIGIFVGYRKAAFSYHQGDNYYKAFGNHRQSMMPMDMDDLSPSYGAAGRIIKVNLPEIIVADRDDVEKTVVITSGTIIKQFRGDASSTDIKQDDFVVVVGSPNSKAQIEAKLIRLLPPPEGFSTSTPK